MSLVGNKCVFKDIVEICSVSKKYSPKFLTKVRREKIEVCSNRREDGFTLNDSDELTYHNDCYVHYTSNKFIEKHLAKKRKAEETLDPSSSKRSKLTDPPTYLVTHSLTDPPTYSLTH
jgi:Zn-dependent M32 family carboxypeptidase